jgi:hypothetical protein
MAGSSLLSMANLARIAKIVALLLFLLPWVTVSCSGQALGTMAGPQAQAGQMPPGTGDLVLAKASGFQLATGTVTPTNPNPNPSATPPANPFEKPDYGILGAALLILLSLAAGFVLKGRQGALVGAVGAALAAVLLCYSVLVQLPRAVYASFAGAGGGSAPIPPADLAQLIKVSIEIGFWLTIAALAAAVLLDLLALKKHVPA